MCYLSAFPLLFIKYVLFACPLNVGIFEDHIPISLQNMSVFNGLNGGSQNNTYESCPHKKTFKCEPYKNKDFKRLNQLSQNSIILDYPVWL